MAKQQEVPDDAAEQDVTAALGAAAESDAAELQASLHDVLDRLEKTRFEAAQATFEDLYRFLLLPGVILIALDALLGALVLRRFP